MKDIENLTTNEVLLHIKQLELDHESLKTKMIKDLDKLEEIEKDFNQANKILLNRLKGK